jgi:hypothetical protein
MVKFFWRCPLKLPLGEPPQRSSLVGGAFGVGMTSAGAPSCSLPLSAYFLSAVSDQVLAFLKEHGPKSVIVTDGLIGCPHEGGIDYPEGKSCRSALTGPGATASHTNTSSESPLLR